MKTTKLLLLCLCILCIDSKIFAQCGAVTNLSVSFANNQSVFVWDVEPNATSYKFQIKFSYSTNWATLANSVNTNSLTYTGLMQSATFNWRVMSRCGLTDSTYSAVQTYIVPCEQPNTLTATNVTGTTATLNWVPAPTNPGQTPSFAVSYRILGSTGAWTSLTNGTTATSINVSGLNSNTAYEYCVSKICSNFWSDPVFGQFTTLYVPCDFPVGLGASSVTNNSAILNWSNVNGFANYYVQYKKSSQTVWTTVYAPNNSLALTNLSQETLYDWRVMANCTNAFQSVYSATKQFTTYSNTCMSYGSNNNSEWIDYFSVAGITRSSGQEIGGYFRSSLSTNLVKGNTYAATISCGYQPGIAMGDYYAIYIDYNKNGTFTDANEMVVAPGNLITSASANYVSNFTIPSNVSQGVTKMRVILRRNTSAIAPCAVGFQGETEDYTVNITANSNAPIVVDNELMALERNSHIGTDVEATLSIYPNPSTGLFTINTNQAFGAIEYEVTTIEGRLIQKNQINNESFDVDLSTQSTGLYLIKLKNDKGDIKVEKMMLNR